MKTQILEIDGCIRSNSHEVEKFLSQHLSQELNTVMIIGRNTS